MWCCPCGCSKIRRWYACAPQSKTAALQPFTREDCLIELTRVLAYRPVQATPERQLEIAAATAPAAR
jgi:hypothetical protein